MCRSARARSTSSCRSTRICGTRCAGRSWCCRTRRRRCCGRLYDLLMANYVAGRNRVLCACDGPGEPRGGREAGGAGGERHVCAGMLWSLHDSPRLKGALLGPRVPRWLKRFSSGYPTRSSCSAAAWAAAQRVAARTWPAAGATDFFITGCSRPTGARTVSRLVRPAAARLAGEHASRRLSAVGYARRRRRCPTDVHEFLAAGTPPIAFSPGSANREAHQFFDGGGRGVRAARPARHSAHKVRSPTAARTCRDSVRHFGFVPLSKLLPHTAALVHHGGIGSCAPRLGGRRAADRAADVVRPVRQLAAARATGRRQGNFGAKISRPERGRYFGAAARVAERRVTLSRAGGALRRPRGAGRCMRCTGATGRRRRLAR